MLAPASRYFSSLGAAALSLVLLSSAPTSAQLTQPKVILAGDQGSYFGWSVAASGDTVAVGATEPGFAAVYERNQGGPDRWGRVVASVGNSFFGDGFGEDIALGGDTLVVGKAMYPSVSPVPGSAYIFERNQGGAGAWGQVIQLVPSNPADAPLFGSSVAISGDTVVVGVGLSQVSPTPPPATGSVYIFQRNPGSPDPWGEVRKLTLPDIAGHDVTVALSGDTLVVGAYQDDSRGTDAGAVYVFERDQGGADQWGQVQKLTASNAAAGQWFGFDAGISGGTIVVGAAGVRAAYIFERGPGVWSETRKLNASDANAGLGELVAIDGDLVVVSAATFSVNTDLDSAYVFRRNQGGPGFWGEAARLRAREDLFSVAVSGNVAVLGNPEWAELISPETYVFDLAPLLIPEDIPALGPFGLAAMVLLLLAAGWWMSGRERRSSRPESL